jgi:hypothetical protein
LYARDRQAGNRADALQEMHGAKDILIALGDLEARIGSLCHRAEQRAHATAGAS